VSVPDLKFERMRYVSAYLLAVLGGNETPGEADIKKILASVGIDADPPSLKRVVAELKGKNIEDLMKAGKKKLASMPTAGPAVAAPAAAAPASKGAEAAKSKEKEKEPESEEEEGGDLGFGLFD